jgi:hypothetical protein
MGERNDSKAVARNSPPDRQIPNPPHAPPCSRYFPVAEKPRILLQNPGGHQPAEPIPRPASNSAAGASSPVLHDRAHPHGLGAITPIRGSGQQPPRESSRSPASTSDYVPRAYAGTHAQPQVQHQMESPPSPPETALRPPRVRNGALVWAARTALRGSCRSSARSTSCRGQLAGRRLSCSPARH